MKKLILPFFIFFILLFGEPQTGNAIPGIYVPGLSKTEFKLCQVRRIFCGQTAVAIIAISVFMIGIMLANNRIKWHTVLIIAIGIIVFYKAEDVVRIFGVANSWRTASGTSTYLMNPMCDCGCKLSNLEFDWFDPGSWFDKDSYKLCK